MLKSIYINELRDLIKSLSSLNHSKKQELIESLNKEIKEYDNIAEPNYPMDGSKPYPNPTEYERTRAKRIQFYVNNFFDWYSQEKEIK